MYRSMNIEQVSRRYLLQKSKHGPTIVIQSILFTILALIQQIYICFTQNHYFSDEVLVVASLYCINHA
jgi:hypothetical protein